MKRVLIFCLSISANLIVCSSVYTQTGGGTGTEHQNAPQTSAPLGQNAPSAKLGAYVYPKNHQSEAQQAKDENECYAWARQQTGIDPDAPASAQQPEAKQAKGGAVKGGAGGAAGGAAIGAIAGDAGTGAAIGATAGAVRGRRQQKKANKEAEKQAQQQAGAQQQQALNKVKSAFSSCIDARGYSVK
jgi:Glycine-zipper domain